MPADPRSPSKQVGLQQQQQYPQYSDLGPTSLTSLQTIVSPPVNVPTAPNQFKSETDSAASPHQQVFQDSIETSQNQSLTLGTETGYKLHSRDSGNESEPEKTRDSPSPHEETEGKVTVAERGVSTAAASTSESQQPWTVVADAPTADAGKSVAADFVNPTTPESRSKFEQQAQKFSVVSGKTVAPNAPVTAQFVAAKIIDSKAKSKCAAVTHNWDERVSDEKPSLFYLREEEQYDRFHRPTGPRTVLESCSINHTFSKMPEKQGMPIPTEPTSQTSFGSYQSSDSFCEDADYFK